MLLAEKLLLPLLLTVAAFLIRNMLVVNLAVLLMGAGGVGLKWKADALSGVDALVRKVVKLLVVGEGEEMRLGEVAGCVCELSASRSCSSTATLRSRCSSLSGSVRDEEGRGEDLSANGW